MAVEDKKYQLGTAENKAFLDAARDNLLNFGTKFPAPDGSSYWLGDDGTPWKDRNRATWITCRMTHVYCLGAFVGFPGAEELVDAGLKGLKGALHDDVNDGWYPEITPEGGYTPTKQCYAHAFVLLASSSATLLGRPGAAELLDHAEKVFLDKFWDDETGLSVDTWNTEFTELDPYRGLNANMHSVEAFLAVADVTGDETWRKRAGRIIEHVLGWAKANNWRIPEHFHSDWSLDLECNREKPDDQFKPYGATPGHGIEWARLITQWANQHLSVRSGGRVPVHRRRGASVQPCGRGCVERGRCARPRIHHRLGRQARRARPYALDAGQGINTSSTLARVTGKESYAKWYATFLEYADSTVMDHVNGSWFHQLDRTNQPIGTVWPGKSDLYHATQSMMIPLRDPSLSIAPAAKKQG